MLFYSYKHENQFICHYCGILDFEIVFIFQQEIKHRWVKLPGRKHGFYFTLCKECVQKVYRPTNAREYCDGCKGRPTICSLQCFVKLHETYSFKLFHEMRTRDEVLAKAIVSRELGNISHSGLSRLVNIRTFALEQQTISSSDDDSQFD